mmetsp:Transcript_43909/g.70246  ORF Transcript_43909/g.70246 Transcript_43909/m.70246 type:complete len:296 (-) Transcript_43909:3439-4326(-)
MEDIAPGDMEPQASEENVIIDIASPKVLHVTGDCTLMPQKPKKTLGSSEMSPSVMKKVFENDQVERESRIRRNKKTIEKLCSVLPSEEQLAIPQRNQHVPTKALQILGDEDLMARSRRVVTKEHMAMARNNPKIIQLLGEPMLILDENASKRFGSDMNLQQRRALMKNRELEIYRAHMENQTLLKKILKSHPTKEQLALPREAQNKVVSPKALDIFGDDYLRFLAAKVVTPDMRKNISPKTLRLLGDTSLLSPKQKQLLGSLEAPQERIVQATPMINFISFFLSCSMLTIKPGGS